MIKKIPNHEWLHSTIQKISEMRQYNIISSKECNKAIKQTFKLSKKRGFVPFHQNINWSYIAHMTPQEALDEIWNRDPALAAVLDIILKKLDNVEHSQDKCIEALIIQLMASNPTGINLKWLEEYLGNR